jgi:murein DD-endopeptidase MepM/ murein hydrolase activator NlpD
MSKILVKRGQSVKQGDVIGKVGSTGLASGPHVCYRFWKNGKEVDALKLKLPNSEPMNSNNKPRYFKYITPLKRNLDSVAAVTFKEPFQFSPPKPKAAEPEPIIEEDSKSKSSSKKKTKKKKK